MTDDERTRISAQDDPSTIAAVHRMLTREDDGRVCRDIPEALCREQPRSFLTHVVSLAATKTGDGLLDPKLALSWLATAIGVPAAMIGLLVPIREAGALLPQLVTAGAIRRMPVRKWAWSAGSLGQAVAVAAIAVIGLRMEGRAAGVGIVIALTVFALARSVCSVSYKDVLGKTVSKATRGTATGTAASIAAAAVLTFGVLLSFGWLPLTVPTIAGAMLVGAGLWLAAAILFMTVPELPGATEGGGTAFREAIEHVALLRTDPQLRRFILVRSLLTATALAPPYIVALAAAGGDRGDPGAAGVAGAARQLGQLGPFVVASSVAGILGGYAWGRLADRSSRRVLRRAGVGGGLALTAAAGLGFAGASGAAAAWGYPLVLFGLMLAYQGVRLGRSTHLVDMTTVDRRAAYTALSNSIIGAVLLVAGGFGLLAAAAGAEVVLLVFAGLCAAAAWVSGGLDEVQATDADPGV